jgi:hypothetical protein
LSQSACNTVEAATRTPSLYSTDNGKFILWPRRSKFRLNADGPVVTDGGENICPNSERAFPSFMLWAPER